MNSLIGRFQAGQAPFSSPLFLQAPRYFRSFKRQRVEYRTSSESTMGGAAALVNTQKLSLQAADGGN